MSEPETTGAEEQLQNNKTSKAASPVHLDEKGTATTTAQLHSVPVEEGQAQPPFLSSEPAVSSAPGWLRPFFSLHVQLTFIFCVILILAVILVSTLIYRQTSSIYVMIISIIAVIIGTLLAFILTGLLLRPLSQVTDAAQAIAIGDLKQRERLPLRLPPQDELDRLAGSLNEMVTRLEHAEQLQHDAEQRFQRFFSDASHQLRTPLTSIRGFTEVLLRGAKDDPETAQRVLKRMKSEAERMTALINDLLTLARLDDAQQLKTQYIDLQELAREGIEQARTQANDERQISLVMNVPGPLGVQADRERLKQLLFILLDNAIKHGRPAPEGVIKLQLDKRDGQAIIRVYDNGEGIPKEDLEHIFDSFYRGQYYRSSASNGPPVVGAGLGLTIASAIVRAHQGSISATSEAGKGTEFVVKLPCVG